MINKQGVPSLRNSRVTGHITATGGNANARVAFKYCVPFTKCITRTNNEHVDGAHNFDIIMPMYNLTEYSDNYSYTSGSLWQYKKDESLVDNDGNPDNVSTNNSTNLLNTNQVSWENQPLLMVIECLRM